MYFVNGHYDDLVATSNTTIGDSEYGIFEKCNREELEVIMNRVYFLTLKRFKAKVDVKPTKQFIDSVYHILK
jgi:hypothetical protein